MSKLLFLTVFSRFFARLLKSGLTVPQVSDALGKQFRNKLVKSRLQQISESVRRGSDLSTSLAEFPDLFPAYLATMCKAGESAGCLPEALKMAAGFFERMRTFKSKMISALAYPTFLAGLSFVAVLLLLVVILPKIGLVYQDFGADLPWQTSFLLTLGSGLKSNGVTLLLVFLVAASVAVGTRLKLKKEWNSWKYKLPILGGIFAKAELSDQFAIIGMLLENGVDLPGALRSAVPLSGKPQQASELKKIAERIESGQSLTSAILDAKSIPDYAKDIIALGEESNTLAISLKNSAEILTGVVEQRMALFTNLFEPIMVLLIAMLIGFIVFSVLMPVVSLDFLAK